MKLRNYFFWVRNFIINGERSAAIGFSARAVGSARAAMMVCRNVVSEEGGLDAPDYRKLRFAELWTKLSSMEASLENTAMNGNRQDALAAKIFTSQTLQTLLVDAVQFQGGFGYTDPHQNLARHYRDALAFVLIDTPNDALLSRIAKTILSDQ